MDAAHELRVGAAIRQIWITQADQQETRAPHRRRDMDYRAQVPRRDPLPGGLADVLFDDEALPAFRSQSMREFVDTRSVCSRRRIVHLDQQLMWFAAMAR